MKNIFLKAISIGMVSLASCDVFAINWFVKSDGNGVGNSWENAASIYEACSQANEGDVIYIAAGNYSIKKAITLDKPLTIIGGFAGTESNLKKPDPTKNKVVFSGASNRCFFINDKSANKSQTRISGITFSNFFPKGKDHGGAIKINYSTSDIILEDLVFDHCSVPESYEGEPNRGANGGALYLNNFDEDMQCLIKNCRFTSCKSREGGALYVNNANASVGKEVSVVNCLFANNSSATNGGAVYFRFGNKVKIENSLFDSNTASTEDLKGSGGAIYLHMNNDVNVKNSTFVGNSATQKGSVIYGNGNKEETQNIVTFENSVLVKNVAKRTSMGRFAIDADNIGTNNIYILKNSIVANNTNARNSIADMFIVNPSDKNVIQNSIVNGEYFDDATAESSKSKGKYKAYLTESQITEILKGRGIKEPSKYRK